MNNSKKIITVSVFALVIIAVLVFVLTSKSDSKENVEISVVSQQLSPTPFKAGPTPIDTLAPTDEGGVDIVKIVGDEKLTEDFMTNTEKGRMGIDTSLRVQVLARDELGNILGYTILQKGAEPETDIREAMGLE